MKKVLAVLMTVTVLISCTVFSAAAAVAYRPDFSNDIFSFGYHPKSSPSSGTTINVDDYVTFSGPGRFYFNLNPIPEVSSGYDFYVRLRDQSLVVLNPGESVLFDIDFELGWFGSSNQVIFYFVAFDGSYLDMPSQPFSYGGSSSISISLSYTNEHDFPVYLREFAFSSDNQTFTACRVSVTDFLITDFSQNAQDSYETDRILGALDGYMNDYESPRPDMGEEVQGAEDEYNNAVDEALGGKSDEEIQAEVGEVADYDFDSLDQDSVSGVKSFMDDLLDALGSEYMSLLLFSCTMGVAIYVIGRKRGI